MFVATRDVLLSHTPFDSLDALRRLNTDWVDVLVGREMRTKHFADADGVPCDLSSAQGRAALQESLSAIGVRVCALTTMTDFSRSDADGEVRWLTDACEAAAAMDVPVVRIDPWMHERQMGTDEFLDCSIAIIRRALDESDEVDLAAENHGSVANSPEFLDRLLDGVDSDRMGVCLDTGNFYWWGVPLEDAYGLIERYAPHAKHTHVKNISYPAELRTVQREVGLDYLRHVCPIPDGDVDHARVVSILKAAGYDRALTAEDESYARAGGCPPEEFFEALVRGVDYLQSLIG